MSWCPAQASKPWISASSLAQTELRPAGKPRTPMCRPPIRSPAAGAILTCSRNRCSLSRALLSDFENCECLELLQFACDKRRLDMTKTELQVALAVATQTNKKIAGVFLETLSTIAYKEIKKSGEFVLPGFGKLVKQKRKARTGFNPKTQQKIKIPAKTVVKFRVAKAAKDAVLGVKK
jgi:DNA-binding protein HU-beta